MFSLYSFQDWIHLIGAVTAIATVVLGVISVSLERRRAKCERVLLEAKEEVENSFLIRNMTIDVVMLGPRGAGKTSIARLWTAPWTKIGTIAPSSEWESYEADIYEFEEEDCSSSSDRLGSLLGAKRACLPVLRIRVLDYPGESNYRSEALKKIQRLNEKVVVLFVFKVGFHEGQIQYAHENAEYFSVSFLEDVQDTLGRVTQKIAKVIVVFNKADYLPREWNDQIALARLKKANQQAIHQIERVFSPHVEYVVVSALTNKGIVDLLGRIGEIAITTKQELKRFKSYLERWSNVG